MQTQSPQLCGRYGMHNSAIRKKKLFAMNAHMHTCMSGATLKSCARQHFTSCRHAMHEEPTMRVCAVPPPPPPPVRTRQAHAHAAGPGCMSQCPARRGPLPPASPDLLQLERRYSWCSWLAKISLCNNLRHLHLTTKPGIDYSDD